VIHSTAVIDPSAKLADSVEVGAYSIIGADVEIGENTWIGPHVVIQGPSKIGAENKLFQFSSIGEVPQDKKYHGETSFLEIGDRNTIREFATINRGTDDGGGTTRIGNDNWLMAYIHIAHDCQVGNNTIFANNASLAGHAVIEDFVILGGFTLVHQFCKIGQHAFCGMGSAISKDIPPYIMVNGSPAHTHGLNNEGIKRKGFSKETLKALRDSYKIIYRSHNTLEVAKSELKSLAEKFPEVQNMLTFLEQSERGILR
jgi:UDP-N-acetylglucosamine acyltransferase